MLLPEHLSSGRPFLSVAGGEQKAGCSGSLQLLVSLYNCTWNLKLRDSQNFEAKVINIRSDGLT